MNKKKQTHWGDVNWVRAGISIFRFDTKLNTAIF